MSSEDKRLEGGQVVESPDKLEEKAPHLANAPKAPGQTAGGQWVTTPDGQRIFLLDEAPPSAPPFISADTVSTATPGAPKIRIIPGTGLPPGRNFIPGTAATKEAAKETSEKGKTADTPNQSTPVHLHHQPSGTAGSPSVPASTARQVPTAVSTKASPRENRELKNGPPTTDDSESWVEASYRLKIEARSEELQEIISFVPSWLVRWGITVVFLTVLGLLVLSWLVRYPEVVHGTLKVTTPSPPVRLVAQNGGELERLMVNDGDVVAAGTHLAVFRSSADYRDVLRLETELEELRSLPEDSRDLMDWRAPDSRFSLGDLEVPYSNLLQALAEYRSFRNDSFNGELAESLRRQIADQQRLRSGQEKKERLLAEELRLMERQRDRKEQLAAGGLLSEQEKDLANSDYLRMLQTAQNARGELVTIDSRITQIRSSLLEASQRQDEQERALRLSVRSSYHALKAAIDRWRQDFIVPAPTDGKVTFFRDLAEGQFLAPYEAILAVIPQEEEAVATSLLEPLGAGRVKPGQRAILRFDTFPPEEYGTVEGRVESISQLMDQPTNDQGNPGYLVRITLPQGLSTTYGKRLEFRQEMGGTADIVTEDLSFLERLFHQLRSVIVNAKGA